MQTDAKYLIFPIKLYCHWSLNKISLYDKYKTLDETIECLSENKGYHCRIKSACSYILFHYSIPRYFASCDILHKIHTEINNRFYQMVDPTIYSNQSKCCTNTTPDNIHHATLYNTKNIFVLYKQ